MKIFKWLKRAILGLFVLISLLLVVGFVFERISRSKAEKIMPGGRFATVNGHRLHYLKKGEGGPTVVFETALDPAGHLQWYNIQKEVAPFAATIAYDRAGILWSERGTDPKSGDKIAEELHLLLEQAGAPKPYILVGHSLGGMLIRFFVRNYPQDVAGVILVDSKCPDEERYLSPKLYEMVSQGLPGGFLKFANSVGLARLMFKHMFPATAAYQYQNSIMAALIHKSAYGILEEQDQIPALKKEAARITAFGSIPLSVLSATDSDRFAGIIKDEKLNKEMVKAWHTMQTDLLKLSTNSKQVLVPRSGHYINQNRPEVIVAEIKSMLAEINNKHSSNP